MAGVGRELDWLCETVVRLERMMQGRPVGKCEATETWSF